MLSDEMLSIKKHFYEKDNLRSTTIMTSTKNNFPSPTLEVKQKWPLIGFTDKPVNKIRDENTLKNNKKINKILPAFKIGENSDNVEEESQNVKVNEKVLGLRSLPVAASHHDAFRRQDYKVCTCMKTNPSTTCSHHQQLCTGTASAVRCTGTGSTAPCTHTSCSHCTRITPLPLYSISEIFYQPFFVEITTQAPYEPIAYYHPDVINELKVPRKPKHRKTTKIYYDKELYYDRDDKFSNKHDDNYYDYLDYGKDVKKPKVNDGVEETIKIHLMDFDDKEKKKDKHKKSKCNHHTKRKDRDKLVQDIFDDLKSSYSDSVIKDCFCGSSSSSSLVEVNHFLLFVVYVLVTLIQ